MMQTKICGKCSLDKPESEFNKQAKCKDGLSTICKACKKILNRQRYLLKTERIKKINAKWRKKNPEKIAEYNKKYSG